jgi:hypothetical protein
MRQDVKDLETFPTSESLQIDVNLVYKLSPDSLSIMEFKNLLDFQVAKKIVQFPLLGQKLSKPWNVQLGREFNMTDDAHLFHKISTKGMLPLYEGKMIYQFDHLYAEPRYWIPEDEGRAAVLGRTPNTGQKLDYQSYRVGFRSTGENTNQRNFISTILPKNVFCGNSIFLSRNINENHELLLYLTALFNSFVLDYAVRLKISRNMNVFYIYQLPVPRLTKEDATFAPIVERAAKLICTTPEFDELAREVGLGSHKKGATNEVERARLRAELDGLVAHLYGLTEEEFAYILTTFPLVSETVKNAAQNAYRDVERGLIK